MQGGNREHRLPFAQLVGGKGDGAHAGKAIAAAIKSVAPIISQAATAAAKTEVDQLRAANEKPAAHGSSDADHGAKKPSITSSTRKGTLIEGDLT